MREDISFKDAAMLQYVNEIENVWRNQDSDAVYDVHHPSSRVTGMFDPIPYMDNVTLGREGYNRLAGVFHSGTEDIELENYEVKWEGTEDGVYGRTQADWKMIFRFTKGIEIHAGTRNSDDVKGGETVWYREDEDKLPMAVKTDLRWEIEEDLTDILNQLI